MERNLAETGEILVTQVLPGKSLGVVWGVYQRRLGGEMLPSSQAERMTKDVENQLPKVRQPWKSIKLEGFLI